MACLLTAEDVGEFITAIISVNPLWSQKNLSIHLIVNPTAGAFTQKKRSLHIKTLLHDATIIASQQKTTTASVSLAIHRTEYASHAAKITRELLKEIMKNTDRSCTWLIVSAGGDGTGLEIQTVLFTEAESSAEKRTKIMSDITVLRLPLGTGNDGTEGHTIEETLQILTHPIHFTNACALKAYYEGHPTKDSFTKSGKAKDLRNTSDAPWYAFNIISVGIDAYVTYMTNRMKRLFPGDVYQLWVNIASAFYDCAFKQQPATIQIIDDTDTVIKTIQTKIEFALLGVSGHRTYGSNHHILPGDENVCITPKMKMLKKILNLSAFSDGSHKEKGISLFEYAHKLRISYPGSLLIQMDGEARLLTPDHFPVIIEKTEPCIQIIESDSKSLKKQ